MQPSEAGGAGFGACEASPAARWFAPGIPGRDAPAAGGGRAASDSPCRQRLPAALCWPRRL